MRYISIDIETTGLDRELCQVLSIGAIIEDTENPLPYNEIPKFHGAIKRQTIYGELYAINLNRDLIKSIVDFQTAKTQEEKNDIVILKKTQFYEESEIVEALFQFCWDNGIVDRPDTSDWSHAQIANYFKTVNGKQYPVLTSSLPKVHITCAGKNFATFDKIFLEKLPRWKQLFSIRQRILDPSILFIDWKNDESLPGMSTCKKRAGLNEIVTHNAVEDAWDVIELLRTSYNKK